MHGKGVYTWESGMKYSGDYKDDQKLGWGVFTWPNGKKYEGQWFEGKQNGLWQITYED